MHVARPSVMAASLALLLCGAFASCGSEDGPAANVDVDADSPRREDASSDDDEVDARAHDAGAEDAGGAADAPFTWPAPGPPCSSDNAARLSDTCLYDDMATLHVRSDVVEYRPSYELWADGADKRRWIWLPPGTTIDTSNMDHWIFPVGTRVWKEFSRNGRKLETRFIERTGTGAGDYRVVSFAWLADGTNAGVASFFGESNVLGTQHDIPSSVVCGNCHNGETGKVLGFSAVQLARGGGGVTFDALVANKKLSNPPASGVHYAVPGTPVQANALGYLHANCGHCHHPGGGEAYLLVDQILRLDVAAMALGDPAKTPTYLTTVGHRTTALLNRQTELRVAAGDPLKSDIYLRMGRRERYFPPPNMPPYGSEQIDDQGRDAVAAWIRGL